MSVTIADKSVAVGHFCGAGELAQQVAIKVHAVSQEQRVAMGTKIVSLEPSFCRTR